MEIQSYLFFDGRCEEALEFYKKTLDAKVTMLMRFKENPEPASASEGCASDGSPGAPVDGEKVMHAAFTIGSTTLMASDGRNTGKPVFQGVALSILADGEAEAHRLFAALSEGGQVQMPITRTFFSPAFGMVADKFGVSWMVLPRD